MVDWDAGSYETTAGVELAPVSDLVVETANVTAGERVIDLACGTGNAAIVAARHGGRVVGIDNAPRLLGVAAQRARDAGVQLELREGDLHRLPVDTACADVVLSAFGVVFATDPVAALGEIRRALRRTGRVVISAWVPDGPIDAMLGAVGQIIARVSDARPAPRVAWHDPAVVGPLAAQAGLVLDTTTTHWLPIHADSVEAYVDSNLDHPVAAAILPAIRQAGAEDEMRQTQLSVLGAANEDPDAFLVHTPYVVHRLVAADDPVST
ncbi:MAG TPA: methyltransferase domain-containing protein [Solirubrobacteraceae bacterium]|jgi:SAM-dependent methyltransferase|nr:methyltransferase domain-containing protein [Solirubrobacteraceae bacterium]